MAVSATGEEAVIAVAMGEEKIVTVTGAATIVSASAVVMERVPTANAIATVINAAITVNVAASVMAAVTTANAAATVINAATTANVAVTVTKTATMTATAGIARNPSAGCWNQLPGWKRPYHVF